MSDHRSSRWLGIELRHLAALAAVAQEGSFRAAAKRLGYVQSAISQQIAVLEQIVGSTLVERARGSGSVQLSVVGRSVLAYADGVLAEMHAARAHLSRVASDSGDLVQVGATHDVAASLLAPVLERLAPAVADGAIQLVERIDDAALLALVREARIDVAFTELPLPAGPYEHTELLACPWRLFGAAAAEPTLDAIARLPRIAQRTSRAFSQVEMDLRRAATVAEGGLQADSWQTLRALADSGAGPALIPARLAGAGGIEVPALPPYRLALVWHREHQPPDLARRFIAAAVRSVE
jgi:molybdate transport repressor ModE-like protein